MRRAVRAIIIKDGQLLVMHRNKFGREYDTLPGGNIEIGETFEQALVREVYDESTVQFEPQRLVFVEHSGDPYGDQYIYLCKYLCGEPKLVATSAEAEITAMGKNLYQPRWLSLTDLPTVTFLTPELQKVLINCLPDKWPTQPEEIFHP